MVWQFWLVWASFQLAAGPLDKPPSAKAIKQFERSCNEGVHIRCIREGVGWLQATKLSLKQRRRILALVASAYMSVRRVTKAEDAMQQVIKLAPCQRAPAGISTRTEQFFNRAQMKLFRSDRSPPILSAIPPNARSFQGSGVIVVKATDNLKVRDVTLYFRMKKTGPFQAQPFARIRKEQFRVNISTKQLKRAKVFHYYIEARDCANRKSTNQANSTNPVKLSFEGKGSSGKAVGGTLLITIGAALIIGSSLAFLNAGIDQERWNTTKDLEVSETLRERITLFQSLGWGGIGLGLFSVGFGAYLLVPNTAWENLFRKKASPSSASPGKSRSFVLHPTHLIHEELEL